MSLEEGESLVNEGEEKNVSSKNSSREKKKRKRKKTEDFFRKFLPSIHRFNFASNKKSLLQVTIVPLWCITKEETWQNFAVVSWAKSLLAFHILCIWNEKEWISWILISLRRVREMFVNIRANHLLFKRYINYRLSKLLIINKTINEIESNLESNVQ